MSEAPEHPERITIGKDPVIGDDTWYAVEGKPNEWFPTAYIRADIAEAEKNAAVREVLEEVKAFVQPRSGGLSLEVEELIDQLLNEVTQ